MTGSSQTREIGRWSVYGLLTVSLSAAAYLWGGVLPSQWQWIAASISAGCGLCLLVPSKAAKKSAGASQVGQPRHRVRPNKRKTR